MSGLKLELTCVKQKVFATHELPEKEPDVTVCLAEVENYWEASIEIEVGEVKAAVCCLLLSDHHQTARRQFAQARKTRVWALEQTKQTANRQKNKAAYVQQLGLK